MRKYIVVFSERFDDEKSMSIEELNKHVHTFAVEADSHCDAELKFFEIHDRDDFKVWNILEL